MKFFKFVFIIIFFIIAFCCLSSHTQKNIDSKTNSSQQDVTKLLLEKEYKTRKITADIKEIEEYKQKLIKALGSKEAFDEKLKESNLSTEEFENIAKEEIKQEKLLKSIGLKETSDSEAEKFYKENKKLFETPERFKVYQILVKNDGATINEIKDKLTIHNFSQMAKKYSQDKKTAHLGGDAGYISEKNAPAEVIIKISKQKVETISPPTKTPNGTYFIYLKDKAASKVHSYESVKLDIKQYLYEEKKANLMQEFLIGLKAKTSIVCDNKKCTIQNTNPIKKILNIHNDKRGENEIN
ncbi:peptidyl-prolyl cis-trans isomerase [bacterium]|nr:peptidyl-prolyl cis-trans isomerase [bacterium]